MEPQVYEGVIHTPPSKNAVDDGQVGQVHYDGKVSARNENHAIICLIMDAMEKDPEFKLARTMEVSVEPFRP